MKRHILLIFIFLLALFTPTHNVFADITTGLISHWKFDDGSGTVAVDSAGTNIGNIVGNPTWTTGKNGGALEFDGVDDEVIVVGDSSLNLTNEITVSAWIKSNDAQLALPKSIVDMGTYNLLFDHGAPQFRGNFNIFDNAWFSSNNTSANPLTSDVWVHLVGIYDGVDVSVYKDGVLFVTNNVGVKIISTTGSDFTIANTTTGSGFFSGFIDDVRVYNRALSSGDIIELYAYTGTLATCGNSTIDTGESCDNGALNGVCSAICSTSCTINSCGGGDTTAPTISNIQTSNITETTVDITFTTDENSHTEVSYATDNYYTTTSGSYNNTVSDWNMVISHSITLLSLTQGTTYYYQVKSQDSLGNSTTNLTDYTFTTITSDITPPSIPTSLTAIAVSSSRIDLNWIQSTDNIIVVGYNIYRCTGISCTPTLLTTTTNTFYSNTNLTEETTYTYTVSAYDERGNESVQTIDVEEVTTEANSPTRNFKVGIGPIPKNFPVSSSDDWINMFAKVPDVGDIVIAQSDWRDSIDESGQISEILQLVEMFKDTYNYTPQFGLSFATEGIDPNLNTNDNSINNWTNEDAQQKYQQVALDICQTYNAKYLALAIETNTYYIHNPEDFDRFIVFYKDLYDIIKSTCPDTKVFVTFQLEQMKGIGDSTWGYQVDPHWDLLEKFGDKLDLVVFTTYPEVEFDSSAEIPLDYYTEISSHTSLPIAFSEIGWSSNKYSEDDQNSFMEKFLALTKDVDKEFANWVFMHDLDFPYFKPLSTVGLRLPDGSAKIAWDSWKALKARTFIDGDIISPIVADEEVSSGGGSSNTSSFIYYDINDGITTVSNVSITTKTIGEQSVITNTSDNNTQLNGGRVSNLTQEQIDSIIGLLVVFNVEPSIIDNVKISLGSPIQTTTIVGPFSIGVVSKQVKFLQQTLAKDFTIYPEGIISGYYGTLTRKAVERLQCKYMEICSGSPSKNGYGLAGPKTRAKLNEVF